MERQYQLSVKSDTTNIDVSSVNADEVARIVQLAGMVEPQKPSTEVAAVDPMVATPVADFDTPDADLSSHSGGDDAPDADFNHDLNNIRKNAGISVTGPDIADSVPTGSDVMQEGYYDDNDEDFDDEDFNDEDFGDEAFDDEYADPHGHSALRASGPNNPRNLPCPTCGHPNRLTRAAANRGYHCDTCADAMERGGDIDYYDDDDSETLDEDVAEYDYGHRKFKDEGEEVDEPDFIWQAVENPQRIKGSAGDNGLIQELHNKLMAEYQDYLAEADDRENDTGVMSPLSDPTKPSFDKDPLSDEDPVDDGSHSPMSTIVRQHAFK